jgi:Holliday junction resolvase RusA-like endonuclease
MAILYEAVIPLNPRTKKNSQQIMINRKTGKPFIMQDSKYKEYEKNAGWFLKKISEPISVPVNVKCVFYREKRIMCDLTNLLEAIDDILVSYGVLSDDNFTVIVSHDGSRVYIDKANPRTEITIETVENQEV